MYGENGSFSVFPPPFLIQDESWRVTSIEEYPPAIFLPALHRHTETLGKKPNFSPNMARHCWETRYNGCYPPSQPHNLFTCSSGKLYTMCCNPPSSTLDEEERSYSHPPDLSTPSLTSHCDLSVKEVYSAFSLEEEEEEEEGVSLGIDGGGGSGEGCGGGVHEGCVGIGGDDGVAGGNPSGGGRTPLPFPPTLPTSTQPPSTSTTPANIVNGATEDESCANGRMCEAFFLTQAECATPRTASSNLQSVGKATNPPPTLTTTGSLYASTKRERVSQLLHSDLKKEGLSCELAYTTSRRIAAVGTALAEHKTPLVLFYPSASTPQSSTHTAFSVEDKQPNSSFDSVCDSEEWMREAAVPPTFRAFSVSETETMTAGTAQADFQESPPAKSFVCLSSSGDAANIASCSASLPALASPNQFSSPIFSPLSFPSQFTHTHTLSNTSVPSFSDDFSPKSPHIPPFSANPHIPPTSSSFLRAFEEARCITRKASSKGYDQSFCRLRSWEKRGGKCLHSSLKNANISSLPWSAEEDHLEPFSSVLVSDSLSPPHSMLCFQSEMVHGLDPFADAALPHPFLHPKEEKEGKNEKEGKEPENDGILSFTSLYHQSSRSRSSENDIEFNYKLSRQSSPPQRDIETLNPLPMKSSRSSPDGSVNEAFTTASTPSFLRHTSISSSLGGFYSPPHQPSSHPHESLPPLPPLPILTSARAAAASPINPKLPRPYENPLELFELVSHPSHTQQHIVPQRISRFSSYDDCSLPRPFQSNYIHTPDDNSVHPCLQDRGRPSILPSLHSSLSTGYPVLQPVVAVDDNSIASLRSWWHEDLMISGVKCNDNGGDEAMIKRHTHPHSSKLPPSSEYLGGTIFPHTHRSYDAHKPQQRCSSMQTHTTNLPGASHSIYPYRSLPQTTASSTDTDQNLPHTLAPTSNSMLGGEGVHTPTTSGTHSAAAEMQAASYYQSNESADNLAQNPTKNDILSSSSVDKREASSNEEDFFDDVDPHENFRKIKKKKSKFFDFSYKNNRFSHLVRRQDEEVEAAENHQKKPIGTRKRRNWNSLISKRNGRDSLQNSSSERLNLYLTQKSEDFDEKNSRDFVTNNLLRRTVFLSVLANVCLLAAKIYIALSSRSLCLIACALDSLLDVISGFLILFTQNIILLRGRDQIDSRYPAGRSLLEPVCTIVYATIMCSASIQICIFVLKHLIEGVGDQPEIELIAIIVLIFTILTKLILSSFGELLSTKSGDYLYVLTKDHKADVFTNTIAFVSALIMYIKSSLKYVDDIGALIIAGFASFAWLSSNRDQMRILSGYKAEPSFYKQISDMVKVVEEVQILKIKAYHFGLKYMVELHVGMDDNVTVYTASIIAQSLRFMVEQLNAVHRCFICIDHRRVTDKLQVEMQENTFSGSSSTS